MPSSDQLRLASHQPAVVGYLTSNWLATLISGKLLHSTVPASKAWANKNYYNKVINLVVFESQTFRNTSEAVLVK